MGALSACATSPTGRHQLIAVSDSKMNALGSEAFAQMKSTIAIERDPAINQYVRCVALPISEQAKGIVEGDRWEIVVFKDDTANAFALPGGKIGVHTGMLKVAKTDAQLAAVLGHEVGHVIAKHGAERMSEGLVSQVVMAGAAVLTPDNPKRGIILGALGLGAQFGVMLPHSRTQESEADVIGLDLMARAGFDPAQSVELWKNMQAAGGGAPPEFMSTHPSNSTRIANLQSRVPEATVKYQQAKARPRCSPTF